MHMTFKYFYVHVDIRHRFNYTLCCQKIIDKTTDYYGYDRGFVTDSTHDLWIVLRVVLAAVLALSKESD